jgi:SAM-dependent methyltransferase
MADIQMTDDRRLAGESLARNDPTGWFEQLYTAAASGTAIVPWDRGAPNPLLTGWFGQQGPATSGVRALVVGCGFGTDAEYVAAQGFHTTAFDVSMTAIQGARERFPESMVEYVVADLLHPPMAWNAAFDLVVESITVQSMPLSVRAGAIANIRRMVAPGGELLVIAGVRADGGEVTGPPWPLTRAEIDSFADGELCPIQVERLHQPEQPSADRWRAVFRRP